MNFMPRAAFGALLAAALGAHAAQPTRASAPSDPLDPAAAVPSAVHASALAGYTPAAKDGAAPPDKAWRAANDALSGQPAHAGHQAQAGAPHKDHTHTDHRQRSAAPHDHKHHRAEAKP